MGLAQRTVAQQLGVRMESVASWERGQANPLARHYGAIVRFLRYDPMPGGDTPGDRLRALRRRLGLTQRHLAARLGLDGGTVTEFELGRRVVSPKVRQAVAAFVSRQRDPQGEST